MKKLSSILALTTLTVALGLGTTVLNTAYAGGSSSATLATDQLPLAKDQTLHFNFEPIGTIDPSLLYWSDDFSLARMLWDTLIRQDNQGRFVPSAAESYTTSEDGLVWTFKLRKDAKWTDGKPVTAQDFVYSWRRLADPKVASAYAYYLPLMNLKNADAVIDGKLPLDQLGVKALDDYTFQVTLSRRTPWFETMVPLSVLAPERQDIIEKYGKAWTQPQNLVSNGPFKLTDYRVNDVINLVKNPNYWDAKDNRINNIVIDFVEEPTATYYGYLTGKYQTGGIPAALKSVAFKEHHKELIYATQNGIYYFVINSETVPDIRVRKALALLINRRVLTGKIYKTGIPTTDIAPTSIEDGELVKERSWFNEPYAQRVKEARELIAQAGYTKDKPLVLEYLTGNPKSDKFFIALQNWVKVGTQGAVQIKLKGVETRIYHQDVAAKRYQLTATGWSADYPQASSFLNQFTCGNAINNTNFCNKEFDKTLEEANSNSDPKQRAVLYAKAHDILADSYEVSGLYQVASFFLKSPRLQGYNPFVPYRYYNDYYILKDNPPCFSNPDADSLCATDLSAFYKLTGFKPTPVPKEDPYK